MIYLIGGKLHQWETGRMLTFTGAPAGANAIQFANQGDTVALEIEHDFTMENGDPNIRIPDKCLQSGKNLLVYLVETVSSVGSDDHSSHILETKVFPVAAKPRPKTYIPIAAEEALGVVRRLTVAAQEAAVKAEDARDKAEEAKLDAQDAAEEAGSSRNEAVDARNKAVEAKDGAVDASDAAVTAKNEAEAAANTAAAESHNAGNEAARAEIFAGHAESYSGAASNAASAAEEAKRNAETAADNAKTYSITAATHANDAKAAAESLSNIGAELDQKAEIDDTTTGENAWSSNNIVDKLCPTTEAEGTSAIFNGMPGAPLRVIVSCSDEDKKLMLVYSGKNVYNRGNYPLTEGRFINYKTGVLSTSGSYCATEDYIPIGHLCGRTITLYPVPSGTNPGMAFYNAAKVCLDSKYNGKGNKIVVPKEAYYMRFCIDNTEKAKKDVQIELGSVYTGPKDFVGESITKTINKDDFVDFNESLDGFVFDEVKAINEEMIIGGYSVGNILDTSGQLVEAITGVSQVKVIGKISPAVAIDNLYNIIEELKTALIGQGANI